MADTVDPPVRHACVHARTAQDIVDEHANRRYVFALFTPDAALARIDRLLRKLRMGRSRRNKYGSLRRRLRALRALLQAARRFWGTS